MEILKEEKIVSYKKKYYDRSINRSILKIAYQKVLKNQGKATFVSRTLTPSSQGSNPCSAAKRTQ